jgi:hypothetical protein
MLAALSDGPSARRGALGNQAGMAALFHFVGKIPHGLLRNGAAFAPRERCTGIVQRCQKFRPLTLTFFPQRQGFRNRIFSTGESSSRYGLADKRFLVWRQMDFHVIKVGVNGNRCQEAFGLIGE